MQQDKYRDTLPGRGGSAALTSVGCGREAKPGREGQLSQTLHSLTDWTAGEGRPEHVQIEQTWRKQWVQNEDLQR